MQGGHRIACCGVGGMQQKNELHGPDKQEGQARCLKRP